MFYDVSSHPALSDQAKDLAADDPDTFEEANNLAEDLLGLSADSVVDYNEDPGTDDIWLVKIERAVALQVNYQLAHGIIGLVQSSDGVGPLSASFRSVDGEFPIVNPQSASIIAQVAADYLLFYPPADPTPSELYVGGFRIAGGARRGPPNL